MEKIITMKQYHDALEHILNEGVYKKDRTLVGTKSVFGYKMRFNLREGFPAITTKKLMWKSVVSELLWFLEGSTDERRLAEIRYGKSRYDIMDKQTIWTANSNKKDELFNELGPIYGHQWRRFGERYDHSKTDNSIENGKDQILELIHNLKNNTNSRRHILSAWNPNQIEEMALPPCHILSQFDVTDNKLSCQVYQRSCDMFLGVPFNIASYALLTHILAQICDLKVADLVWVGGDVHIYSNHMDAVKEQLTRKEFDLPTLEIPELKNLDDVRNSSVNDYILKNYQSWPAISAPMAV